MVFLKPRIRSKNPSPGVESEWDNRGMKEARRDSVGKWYQLEVGSLGQGRNHFTWLQLVFVVLHYRPVLFTERSKCFLVLFIPSYSLDVWSRSDLNQDLEFIYIYIFFSSINYQCVVGKLWYQTEVRRDVFHPVLGFLVIVIGNGNKRELQEDAWEWWGGLADTPPTHKDKFTKIYDRATWVVWEACKGFWLGNIL